MNPNGAVPLLEDGSFHLWESTAIMQYLAEKKGNTDFYPQDAKIRVDITRWTAWTLLHFGRACGTIVYETLIKAMFKLGEPDRAAVESATEDFHEYAAVLDEHLGKNGGNLVTTNVTPADFTLASTLMYAVPAQLPWDKYQHIKSWYAKMEKLDAWKKSAAPMPQ